MHNEQYFLFLIWSLIATVPHFSHTSSTTLSESSTNFSCSSIAAPCPTRVSPSISPKRRPPSLSFPSVGCLVSICTGPRDLACILCATMWNNLLYETIPTNTSPSILSPVTPSYNASFPSFLKPDSKSIFLSSSSLTSLNGVPSISSALRLAAFPASISIKCPIVILVGIAWGFRIKSGFTPSAVNGMSSSGIIIPTTPFCPCLLENLSPNSGIISLLILIFASLFLPSPSVIITVSTIPSFPFLMLNELSFLFSFITPNSEISSRNLGGLVLPAITSPLFMGDSISARPSSPSFL